MRCVALRCDAMRCDGVQAGLTPGVTGAACPGGHASGSLPSGVASCRKPGVLRWGGAGSLLGRGLPASRPSSSLSGSMRSCLSSPGVARVGGHGEGAARGTRRRPGVPPPPPAKWGRWEWSRGATGVESRAAGGASLGWTAGGAAGPAQKKNFDFNKDNMLVS